MCRQIRRSNATRDAEAGVLRSCVRIVHNGEMPVVAAGHQNAAVAQNDNRAGPAPTASQVGCDRAAAAEGRVQAAVGFAVAGQGQFVVSVAVQNRTGYHNRAVNGIHGHGVGRGAAQGEGGSHQPSGPENRIGIAVVCLTGVAVVTDQPKLSIASCADD